MSWQEILNSYPLHDEQDLSHPWLVPLNDYRLIVAKGPDAESFLQGQCTCDFRELTQGATTHGAHCTHKGRMNSNFLASQLETESIGLRLHESISEHALNALKKYAVFSKVELDISDQWFCFGAVGNSISEKLASFLTLPETGKASSNEKCLVIKHHDEQYELWCKKEHITDLLNTLNTISLQKNSQLWKLSSIRQGLAEIEAPLIEKLLPQEINLQCIDGVSFKKGCYTGQEIVARLHYKGQLKKHMYRGVITSEHVPEIGDSILENAEKQKSRGIFINIAQISANEYEFLALCDDELIHLTRCVTEKDYSANIQWKSLPYAIS